MRFKLFGLLPLVAIIGCAGSGGTGAGVKPGSYTLAGSSTAGTLDGKGVSAEFSNPVNVVVARDGTAYVADFDYGLIRKITPAGYVSTLTKQTNFQRPFGMAISQGGDLYVSTDIDDNGGYNHTSGTVWKVDTTTGLASVVVRDVGRPRGLAVYPDGRVVLSDLLFNTISILDPSTGVITPLTGSSGNAGFKNGTGTSALFSRPYGATVLADGTILVADQNNNCIRQVTLSGAVTTYVGTGAVGATNGSTAIATFNGPQDVKVDGRGRVFIADTTGKLIRLVANGQVSTVAGNGVAGYRDGALLQSEFFGLEGFFVTSDGIIYAADGNGGDDSQPYDRVRIVVP